MNNITSLLETSMGEFVLQDSFQVRRNLVEVMCDLFNTYRANDTELTKFFDVFQDVVPTFDIVDDTDDNTRQIVISVIGYVAGVLTTLASSPQIYKTIKTRNTLPLSIYSLLVLWFGLAGWIIYGSLLNNWVIIICNVISISLYTLLIGLKIVFDKQAKAKLRAEAMNVEMDAIYKPLVTNNQA